MAYYYTCPFCGSNLDPGERCDCQVAAKQEPDPVIGKRIRIIIAPGQLKKQPRITAKVGG